MENYLFSEENNQKQIFLVVIFLIRDALPPLARPLFRDAFLHGRFRREPDVVFQFHLDVGTSRGLYFGVASIRNVLRNRLDFFAEKSF